MMDNLTSSSGQKQIKAYDNVLLIAGTGRNSGKTTLATKVIGKFAGRQDVVGVKISPHFHQGTSGLEPIETSDHFNLYLEKDASGDKDSSKMFAAGALKVYYIEVHDQHLREAFERLTGIIPPFSPVVVESPALGNMILPGVFFIVDHPNTFHKKAEVLAMIGRADKFINTAIEDLDEIVQGILFKGSGWHFRAKTP